MSKKLSQKQQAFINHYLICWDGAKAARLAGYSEKTARAIASENLTKPDIKAAIDERVAELKMSADEVLLRLANMARSNMADFARVYTNADVQNLGEQAQVIKKWKRKITRAKDGSEYEESEIELYDAQSALVHIGRVHGLFSDKIEHSGSIKLDLSSLTNEQLQRIVAGDDPAAVITVTTTSSG